MTRWNVRTLALVGDIMLLQVLMPPASLAATATPLLGEGMQAFQAHRWLDAMADFLEVLRQDPTNTEAHKYIPLTIREIESHNQVVIRDIRLSMLSEVSQRLENNRRDARPVDNAVADMTHSEERRHDERWTTWLEEARLERQLGHLLAANDLLLRIVAEKPDHPAAQQELSLLQVDGRDALEKNANLLIQERYALEGFIAYAQADYNGASVAWGKCRTIVQQTYPPPQAAQQLASLHFESYAQRADADVAEKDRAQKIQTLFAQAVQLYQEKHFMQALDAFRQVALASPEFPQLAYYLMQAETGVENERNHLLGEAKRREIAAALENGIGHMEHAHYAEAESAFKQVLELDPSNPQGRSYLAMAQAELNGRHDPKAAQQHYEAGLIAYASGKLEDAIHEWKIATRLDPQLEKASIALGKVEKELALNNDLPNIDPALPRPSARTSE